MHTKPTVAQLSLADNFRRQRLFISAVGSSPVKNRQYNHYFLFFEQIEITFSGVKFTLLFYFYFFVFLYLITGRRQLLKLRKFPGVVLRCRLHPSPPSKKCICKQTFDCCRECITTPSTRALAWPGTLMARVRTERTNACAIVSTKNRTRNYPPSFQHHPLWYSRLQRGST